MRMKPGTIVAAGMMAALQAVPISAQVLPVRTMVIENRQVLLLPWDGPDLSGAASLAGVNVAVSTGEEFRTYRAAYRGRTYTAYVNVSGPPRRLAFDPAQRRFQVVDSTIRVELHDYDDLESIVLETGALYGKAYPEPGFALIRLNAETDPAGIVERLKDDPRVRDAQVRFEAPLDRPRVRSGARGRPAAAPAGWSEHQTAKDSLRSQLAFFLAIQPRSADFEVVVSVFNLGAGRSEPAVLQAALFTLAPEDLTRDPPPGGLIAVLDRRIEMLPALDGKGAPYKTTMSFPLRDLDAGRTYYVMIEAFAGIFFLSDQTTLALFHTGFTLDSSKRIQRACVESGRGSVAGAPDPLGPQQWHLSNTGQSSYAFFGGTAGEDLRMRGALADGPTGSGVRVAVVDTGLEICHPDLAANVEAGASFNFNALPVQPPSPGARMHSVASADPFDVDPTSGHGTAVAGLIGAVADNGIGGRGVAPGVRLRGYNLLNATDLSRAVVDSLGASGVSPNSAEVDIFNMSFGGLMPRPENPDPIAERTLAYGTRRLRSGRGAIYVKSGGNGFGDCLSLARDLNASVGCTSSGADPLENLPYLIVAGAFNANGKRSSYSSAGSNLWISAPGGEDGYDRPATLTVDQMGWDRGIGAISRAIGMSAPLDLETAVNPHGDYTALMNGTSAAAPNVSGSVAVLLEASPGLTWRDVKHILANTARRIDPDIEPVEAAFGAHARTVRLAWTENSAGYAFHDWYGFGALDLDAALAFAREYAPDSLGAFRQSGWYEKSSFVAIPDNNGAGLTETLNVSGISGDANIEAVSLEVDIRHPFPNDLGVQLVSPHGTRSVLIQVFNEVLAVEDMYALRWRRLSNAFYGENPNGAWRIEVFDAAAGDTGHLDAWRLRFHYGDHPEKDFP